MFLYGCNQIWPEIFWVIVSHPIDFDKAGVRDHLSGATSTRYINQCVAVTVDNERWYLEAAKSLSAAAISP
jgi:hypothetical protein